MEIVYFMSFWNWTKSYRLNWQTLTYKNTVKCGLQAKNFDDPGLQERLFLLIPLNVHADGKISHALFTTTTAAAPLSSSPLNELKPAQPVEKSLLTSRLHHNHPLSHETYILRMNQ
jgi:hypothetical protein